MNHPFAFERRLSILERRMMGLERETRRIQDRLIPLRGSAFEAAAIAAGDGFNVPISDGGTGGVFTIDDAWGSWPIVSAPSWVNALYGGSYTVLGAAVVTVSGTVITNKDTRDIDLATTNPNTGGIYYFTDNTTLSATSFQYIYALYLDGTNDIYLDILSVSGVDGIGPDYYPLARSHGVFGGVATASLDVVTIVALGGIPFSLSYIQSNGSQSSEPFAPGDDSLIDAVFINQGGLSTAVTIRV